MSLFRKPNRKFRQRETTANSDDEEDTSEILINKPKQLFNDTKQSPTSGELQAFDAASNSRKEKSDPCKVKNLLSFHDEEDESTEVFKLKKSNYSRRLMKQRERERRKTESQFTGVASKSINQAINRPGSGNKKTEYKSRETLNVLSGHDAEDIEIDSDENNEQVNPFKNVLESGKIPDAATIYAMKKHRQMAREMGDFIPVEDNEKEEEEKSRLVRDDDNDRSDDDDEPSRINFTVNTEAVERQKIRETFLSLQDVSTNDLENEDADELERWEREQIKKGVGVIQVGSIDNSQNSDRSTFSYSHVPERTTYVSDSDCARRPAQAFSIQLLKTKEVTLTTSDIKARLEERLHTLKTLHQTHEDEIQDCTRELTEAKELIEKLTLEAPLREQNYSLYQSMSGYVQDLVECMDVKVAHIDLLESKMMELHQVRAHKLAARRELDVRDQSEEYSALSSELLKGINIEYLSEKNSMMDESKLRRAAEREGRRMRRRKQRERSGISNAVKHQDGLSSDDEEADIDLIKYKESRQNILNEAGSIFEDVVEDFGTLEGVMKTFENWKLKQITSYSEAYVPLCLPKIFGIFVKLALLDWNPLEEERNFEESSWYHKLVQYCYYASNTEQEDPDLNLLPGVMERIVLPKVASYIQNVWNPMSQSETSKLIKLIRNLHDTYPTINGRSKQLQLCLKSITTQISKALDNEIFIPLYPKELLENRTLGASCFFQRQFWSAVKLFQNIVTWDGIIADQPLQQMAFGSLLNRYILMGLHTSILLKDTLEKCKTIVGYFPKSWVKNAKGGSTLPLLKQFSGFLGKLASTYDSMVQKRSISTEDAKHAFKEIVQLLVVIEALDDAVCIAKKYSVSAFKK